jgi:hypothetical protein
VTIVPVEDLEYNDGTALVILALARSAPKFVEYINESGQFNALATEVLGVNLNEYKRQLNMFIAQGN